MLTTSRRGFSGRSSELNTPSKSLAHVRLSTRYLSRPCSYSKVEHHVPVSVDFDDVLEFGVGDDGHGICQCLSEFQRQAHAALFHETEVIFFTQIGGQVESVQGISVVGSVDEESFVRTQFSRSGKYGVVRSYILSRRKVRLYGSDRMLLLSVQIHSDLLQIEMLKVERVSFPVTVERSIVHQSDTLRNSSVADDRKVRQYVEELHRYLNVANRAPVRQPPHPKINWLTGDIAVRFSSDLARILGFDEKVGYVRDTTAPHPISLNVVDIYSMYVYCDLLQHVVVGDTKAPLLRIVNKPPRTFTRRHLHKIFNPILYVPPQKKNFDTVEINIMTDTGDPVPFRSGKSILVLEFRRTVHPYFAL